MASIATARAPAVNVKSWLLLKEADYINVYTGVSWRTVVLPRWVRCLCSGATS